MQHVTRVDQEDPSIARQIEEFKTKLNERLDDKNFRIDEMKGVFYLDNEPGDDTETEYARKMLTPEDKEYGNLTGIPVIDVDKIADDEGQEVIDKYIGTQLRTQLAGEEKEGTIIGQATDNTGEKIGRMHCNPLFDTSKFMVKFHDKSVHRFRANQIAKAIYSQVYQEF